MNLHHGELTFYALMYIAKLLAEQKTKKCCSWACGVIKRT